MRAAFLTFFGIALLGLPQPAHAKGGGGSSGGSSSDGSSGSGFDLWPSDRERDCYNVTAGLLGNITDPFNNIYTNQWLYKFVGSYYNGSVVSIPAFFISSLGEYWVLTVSYYY